MGRKTLPNPGRKLKITVGRGLKTLSSEELAGPGATIATRALEAADRATSAPGALEAVRTTPAERAMQEIGKTILRMEMKRAGGGYAGLAERLVKMGMPENEPNVRNKIARGKFSMGYFLACLRALGTKTVSLDIEVPKAEAILATPNKGRHE
jgi:hypothetical protein